MTPAEYTDPQRFPLTTLKGLPPRWQLLLDAGNLHWLGAAADGGAELTRAQERRLKELRVRRRRTHPWPTKSRRCGGCK